MRRIFVSRPLAACIVFFAFLAFAFAQGAAPTWTVQVDPIDGNVVTWGVSGSYKKGTKVNKVDVFIFSETGGFAGREFDGKPKINEGVTAFTASGRFAKVPKDKYIVVAQLTYDTDKYLIKTFSGEAAIKAKGPLAPPDIGKLELGTNSAGGGLAVLVKYAPPAGKNYSVKDVPEIVILPQAASPSIAIQVKMGEVRKGLPGWHGSYDKILPAGTYWVYSFATVQDAGGNIVGLLSSKAVSVEVKKAGS